MRGAVEAVTDLIHDTAAAIDPDLGRFLQRDPIGIWGDGINFGNGYAYVGGDPENGRDPSGKALRCTPDKRGKTGCANQWTCRDLNQEIRSALNRAKEIAGNIRKQSNDVVNYGPSERSSLEERANIWEKIVKSLDPDDSTLIVDLWICSCQDYPSDNDCNTCDVKKTWAAFTDINKKEVYLCCKSAEARGKKVDDPMSIMGILIHELSHIYDVEDLLGSAGFKAGPEAFRRNMSLNNLWHKDAYSYNADWAVGESKRSRYEMIGSELIGGGL
jgi:RHS repeat-associated protein